MDLLCEVCDRSIIENQCENNNYLGTLQNKSDKSLYNKYIIFNKNLDGVNKISLLITKTLIFIILIVNL